jgi:hypothetical protein
MSGSENERNDGAPSLNAPAMAPIVVRGDALTGGVYTVEPDESWPRFLGRDAGDRDPSLPAPPPLPVVFRCLGLVSRALANRQAVIAGSGTGALLLAAAALWVWHGGEDRLQPLPAGVQKVSPANETVATKTDEGLRDLSTALNLVAGLEARLDFAANFSGHVQNRSTLVQFAESAPGVAAGLGASGAADSQHHDRADPVGLLILRNLPETVSFPNGAQAGIGAWAIPAGDPGQLVMTLIDGSGEPVVAQVEMISRAGLSLGTLRLQLRKQGEAAVAQEAAEPLTTAALPNEQADEAAEPAKPERAQAKKPRKAHSQGGQRKRSHHNEVAAKVKESAPAVRQDEKPQKQDEAVANGETADKDKPQGAIGKFFSWLKGDGKKDPKAPEKVDESSTRYGLGMVPQ